MSTGAGTADGKPSSWFQRFLLPGFAFKAVVIGGGYATGRELAEFFLPSGPWGGLAAMVLAMVIWSGICALTFAFARHVGAYDYRAFFQALLGRFWVLFEIAYVAFVVLILSVFFRKLPAEIFEAAVLDHCSRFQTFFRIALPLALPSVGATGLFAFMLSYSEYMFSMVLSGDAATRPVSVVMAALARNTDVSWSLLNTAIFIAIVPTLVLVVFVWRFVVEGLLSGAVKG